MSRKRLMGTFLKILMVVLLLPIALVAMAFIGVVIVSSPRQPNSTVVKQQIEKKEINNVVNCYIKENEKEIPLQVFYDNYPYPDDLKDNPSDDAITRVEKKTKRDALLNDNTERTLVLRFIYNDSYLKSAQKEAGNYNVSLEIPSKNYVPRGDKALKLSLDHYDNNVKDKALVSWYDNLSISFSKEIGETKKMLQNGTIIQLTGKVSLYERPDLGFYVLKGLYVCTQIGSVEN